MAPESSETEGSAASVLALTLLTESSSKGKGKGGDTDVGDIEAGRSPTGTIAAKVDRDSKGRAGSELTKRTNRVNNGNQHQLERLAN
jgi:hypothetical protein